MSLATFGDTIVALSTPLGTSALATLRLSGIDSIRIASKCIESKEKLFTCAGGDSFYTNITRDADHIDDVVVTVWRAPRSYTGEDIIEFHTHGSPVIADLVQHLLISNGARLAEPGEFSRRAFINGKLGLEELERTLMRLDASSETSLTKVEQFLKAKYDGLRSVYEDIISLLAEVNAEIDFGESDNAELNNFAQSVSVISAKLNETVTRGTTEQLNRGYYSIALTGPPNVGKSSLFNALLNYERSIVSDIAGTTRDYLEAFMMLEGFKVKLVDTAGLRSSNDVIESRGIALGRGASEKADITLRITDPESRDSTSPNGEIIVHNKCDLDSYAMGISISANTGYGIPRLTELLRQSISELDSLRTGYIIAESERETIRLVQGSLAKLSDVDSIELSIIAEELRLCADKIASLFGMNINEDNLSYIFNKMCIGK